MRRIVISCFNCFLKAYGYTTERKIKGLQLNILMSSCVITVAGLQLTQNIYFVCTVYN